ncbi:protein GRAVITROPIC IN THE LIGHT 1-like [Amaranthus tricolor]|uniref:protein GRAVITROPIC IN THE LIGHT 1-like n=1 Tax=Amaranthus tricolor TaxID=29722 RepID=UPI002590586B|nr:protein GRAVITROPIC IN THE LIGHT 1-like [Amaranthus tricolor]
MDCIKQPSSESTRSKISKTFSKCIHPQTPSRYPPNPKLKTLSEELNISLKDFKSDPKFTRTKSQKSNSGDVLLQEQAVKIRAAKEAVIAKLFASVSSIKAAYAELQSAQFPYNFDSIQSADESLVSELSVLSELKKMYLNKSLDLPPPHVTHLLAEIQEQQNNIKTYEITMKQMEWQIEQKDSEILRLNNNLEEITRTNKTLERKLNSSGILYQIANNLSLNDLNQCHFIRVLHYALGSLRDFVKHLVGEMESKNWDIDSAAKAIEPKTMFSKPKHRIFALESYVSQLMFDGFNHHTFFLPNEGTKQPLKQFFFETFKKLQSLTASQIFIHNPGNPFGKFCREKYLKIIHPKMECSFFGNLDQRKVVSSGAFPATEFFTLFAEMCRRIWMLHCLAFSFNPPAVAFQVRKRCRFSEVYMENVAGEDDVINGVATVSFTVIPGIKIGKTVVQSQVYLSSVDR